MGISRRSLLHLGVQSVAGAGLFGAVPGAGLLPGLDAILGEPLLAASSEADAVVCLYLFGGVAAGTFESAGRLHPELAALAPLHDKGILKVIRGVNEPFRLLRTASTPEEVNAQRYSALRFLPGGFATLEWAARLANVDPLTGAGAFTFNSGVSLVAPGAAIEGPQFENPRLRAAAGGFSASFPDTVLGRQLADVAGLLGARERLGMSRQVFLVSGGGFTAASVRGGAADRHYAEVAEALVAFHAATEALGVDRRVVTFTDGDLGSGAGGGTVGARLVMGSAIGAAAVGNGVAHDVYAGTMAHCIGLPASTVRRSFPGYSPASASNAL